MILAFHFSTVTHGDNEMIVEGELMCYRKYETSRDWQCGKLPLDHSLCMWDPALAPSNFSGKLRSTCHDPNTGGLKLAKAGPTRLAWGAERSFAATTLSRMAVGDMNFGWHA